MGKRRKTKAIKGEFNLPKPIIQHIQSFLTTEEAAQTTLLSKSWREAWLTRPNLVFVSENSNYKTPLLELATETVQRYEESNLKIQSFTIRVSEHPSQDLIAKSLKLGATHLNLSGRFDFVLQNEIVFGSEKLVGLSVQGCRIEIGSSDLKVIRCSGLESLSLKYTNISLDELSNLFSSIPSIQKLSLSDLGNFQVDESVIRSFGLGLTNLHSLTSLHLSGRIFDTLFLSDVSSRFHSLKDLTLHVHSTGSSEEAIQISCRSLERLNFAQLDESLRRVKFDVPSIRRFTYHAPVIPLLSFKSTSTTWESFVKIDLFVNPDSFWFRRLNETLTKLRWSKIHLSLKVVRAKMSFDYEPGEIQEGLQQCEPARVENLTVDLKALSYLCCYALFDGLFQICRPKFITQQHLHSFVGCGAGGCGRGGTKKAKSENFLCKAFLGRKGGTSESHNNFLYYGLRDLEEVNVELFDEEVAVWRHVTLESLLEQDDSTNDQQRIRFQLKW